LIEGRQSELERVQALGVLLADLIEFFTKSPQLDTESATLPFRRLAERRCRRKQDTGNQCTDDTVAHSSRERQRMCESTSMTL
jgi:hypothetical protein